MFVGRDVGDMKRNLPTGGKKNNDFQPNGKHEQVVKDILNYFPVLVELKNHQSSILDNLLVAFFK